MSNALSRYLALQAELIVLINAGCGEGPTAEALRDQMDAPWYELTAEEVRVVEAAAVAQFRPATDP